MEATLYANLNRQTLGEKLDGSAFSWPSLVAGDTASLRLRFTKRIQGKNQLVSMAIEDVYAAIAVVDRRPLTGTFKLKIGPLEDEGVTGTNLTTALTPASTAENWQTALNALTLCGAEGDYGVATVTADNGSLIIKFANLEEAGVIVLAENELAPSTLLRVIPVDRDGTFEHDCRLIQAPATMTSTYSIEAGSAPSVVRHRAGSNEDGAAINEVQILIIPPEFEGAAEFERNGLRSAPFSKYTKPARHEEILDPLADEGGIWSVTDILPNELWIEFQGEMAATPQDLLTTHVVRAPQGDCAFTLDLNQPAIFALLREKDSVDAYVHIVVIYEDADTEELRRWSYLQRVKLVRPVVWNGLDVNEAIDFLKKPGDSYLPVASGQIITGSQHYSRSFPTSLEVSATSFTVTHDLGEELGHIVVGVNTTPGKRLIEGTDYTVTIVSDDQFTIQLLAGGYFDTGIVVNDAGTWKFIRTTGGNVACLDHLVLAFSSIGPKSAFADHDHYKSDIIGLIDDLTNIFGRLSAVEAGVFPGGAPATSELTGSIGSQLRGVWTIPTAKVNQLPAKPETLLDWDPFGDGSQLRDLRLLPAVHVADEDLLNLPLPIPAPSAAYREKVYRVSTTTGPFLTDQYVACDGFKWYRVIRESDDETTWYPYDYNVELFSFSISPDQLALRTLLDLAFGLELALFDPQRRPAERRSRGRMSLILERGVRVSETSPAGIGSNIDTYFGSPVVLAQHDFDLTDEPAVKRMQLTIARDGAGTLTAKAAKFLQALSPVSAPASADFAIRARIGRVDFENLPEDARGILAIRGLSVGLDGLPDAKLGRWSITAS